MLYIYIYRYIYIYIWCPPPYLPFLYFYWYFCTFTGIYVYIYIHIQTAKNRDWSLPNIGNEETRLLAPRIIKHGRFNKPQTAFHPRYQTLKFDRRTTIGCGPVIRDHPAEWPHREEGVPPFKEKLTHGESRYSILLNGWKNFAEFDEW